WKTVLLSGFNIPFLLGVLTYFVRDYGRRWRWAAFAAMAVYLTLVPARFVPLEGQWVAYSVAGAGAVWFVTQTRQLASANPLVRAGEYTYGLYLVHVPIIMGLFAGLVRAEVLVRRV